MTPTRRTVLRGLLAAPLLGLPLLGVSGLTACTGGPAGPPPPDPAALLRAAAADTAALTSARYAVDVDERVTAVPLRTATGRVTATGDVDGTAVLDQAGRLVEIAFAVVAGTLFLRGPTGGVQQLPAEALTAVYDPRRLLDPAAGLAAALTAAAENGSVQGREDVEGVACWRVAADVDFAALPGIVPGVASRTATTWWIATDAPRLVRAAVDVPSGGALTLTLSEPNAPVAITPPS